MALEFVCSCVVSSVLQEIVDAMKAVAADTFNLWKSDIETELKDLENTYVDAQNTLATIDGCDLLASKLHRNWVADTQRACYDVEDFIVHLKNQIFSEIEDANFLRAFFTKVSTSREVRDLKGELTRLIASSGTHHIPRSSRSKRRRYRPDINTQPVALAAPRVQDTHDIVSFFQQTIIGVSGVTGVGRSSGGSMSTVLIVGMFGIGKTTLAQAVMNDGQIKGHFRCRLWVTVSGKFNVRETLRSIIRNLQNRSVPAELSDDDIIRIFEELCKGKQILVVLDDVHNFVKPQEDWKTFKEILCGCSCTMFGVIITTRNPKVDTAVASLRGVPALRLHLTEMSEEACASLILQKPDSVPTTVRWHYCQRAARICKGLPLVADIIGQSDLYEWSNMQSDDLWAMPEFREQIFPALRLDYSDLSTVLRNCLPYFSLFPKGYKFNEDDLVQLWLAEGFIRPPEAGIEYLEWPAPEKFLSHAFDEVSSRSILQIDSPFDQEPKIYKMHEFIHCYAQYIGSNLYFRINEQLVPSGRYWSEQSNVATQLRKARHISFMCESIPPELWDAIKKCKRLRTVISLCESEIGQLNYNLFLKLERLRVLVLSKSDINELPESLGELKHLRLLDVSETKIKDLPGSTVKLNGLLVLKLNYCSELRQLPKDISNLTQLLHLEVDKESSLMPPHIGKLTKLRTLLAFKVGRKDGHRVTELKNMKYLKGSICLTNLENVRDEVEARQAKLSDKPLLRRVELEWRRNLTNQSLAEKILAGFEPHENLEELQLNGYGGVQFPCWLSSPECKLTRIHIRRCGQFSTLPALGHLQHLRTLRIEEMDQVKFIGSQFFGNGAGAGFPELKSLEFHDMLSLEKWFGLQTKHMPRLRELVITDCPELTSLPELHLLISLVSLEINNCPALQALPKEWLPSSLETLYISECPLLKQCCCTRRGADWDNIKKISRVYVDGHRIQTPDT